MNVDDHVKVVIACTGDDDRPRMTIDSLLETTDYPTFEVVVSANDNGPTDLSFLDSPGYGRVKLLKTKESLNKATAFNAATVPGDAAFYAFLDSRCLIDQRDWLRRAVDCLRQFPCASMVQPEVAVFAHGDIDNEPHVDHSRGRLQRYEYCTRWAWPYCDYRHVVEPLTTTRTRKPFEAMSGSGMVVLTPAATFHRLGKFESEVKGSFPETMDYCVRAWLLGFPMIVEPEIRICYHAHRNARNDTTSALHLVHGTLLTAYKYLSPRRRDLAELHFRRCGLTREVDVALSRVQRGQWLSKRVRHLQERIQDDDWLFAKFEVYEERFAG